MPNVSYMIHDLSGDLDLGKIQNYQNSYQYLATCVKIIVFLQLHVLGTGGINTLVNNNVLYILLCKGLKGKASVPKDDLIPKTRCCRNQLSMAFQTPIANTDVYKGSFFPQTIRDWNALPDSLILAAEDAKGCVAKLTSLVRARD